MADLPAFDDRVARLAAWFEAAHQGDGSPWLTPGETELLASFGVTRGEGVRMMEAATHPFREPPRDPDWEIIGADDPGENWEDHRDPARALALVRRKLRAAGKAGARLHYKLWLEPA